MARRLVTSVFSSSILNALGLGSEREREREREEGEIEREGERERERGRVRERERGGLLRRVCPSHCCWCFPAKDRTDVFVGLDISPRIIPQSVMTSMECERLAWC